MKIRVEKEEAQEIFGVIDWSINIGEVYSLTDMGAAAYDTLLGYSLNEFCPFDQLLMEDK